MVNAEGKALKSHFGSRIVGKIDKNLEKGQLFPLIPPNLIINHLGFLFVFNSKKRFSS